MIEAISLVFGSGSLARAAPIGADWTSNIARGAKIYIQQTRGIIESRVSFRPPTSLHISPTFLVNTNKLTDGCTLRNGLINAH